MEKFKVLLERRDAILEWYDSYIDKYYLCDKGQYGHVWDRHFNKSERELVRRITREKVAFASSFCLDDDRLLDMLNKALHFYREDIALFMASKDDSDYQLLVEASDLGYNEPIGDVYIKDPNKHNWKDGAIKAHDFVLVLKHARRGNGLYIVTGYPITDDFCHWD